MDTLTGTEMADVIWGAGMADMLSGMGGDDRIEGGAGADTINGGTGSDTAVYKNSAGGVDVDLTRSVQKGGEAEGDVLVSIENVRGGMGADTIMGAGDNNMLYGQGGHDLLDGMGGNDMIRGGKGSDMIMGGSGMDTLKGDIGNDTVKGGDGDDLLRGGKQADMLYGGMGDDTLMGDKGDDILMGDAGMDVFMFGSADSDSYDMVKDFTSGEDLISFGTSMKASELKEILDTAEDTPDGMYKYTYGTTSFVVGTKLKDTDFPEDHRQPDSPPGTTPPRGQGGVSRDLTAGNDNWPTLFEDDNRGHDNIRGLAGNDIIDGGDGDDDLDGGAGNDSLNGRRRLRHLAGWCGRRQG